MKKVFLLFALIAVACVVRAEERPDFMVMSDMHVMSTSLFDNGTAWATYLQSEPKLDEKSVDLYDEAITRIKMANPKMLLLTGDLTKDGEKVSHEYVASKLAELETQGIKVYVIPGNHDIANPQAKSYLSSEVASVETVTAEEFKTIYGAYGYDEAVMKDGLSYMVYPEDGLAIICINSTKDNVNTTRWSEGGITEETMTWIEKAAQKARLDGRYVIGMMHHQVMAHFKGQASFAPTYIANGTEGYPELSGIQERLVKAGIRTMFTGHFHTQSISKKTTAAGDLYDISTGALCQYPSPIRSGWISSEGLVTLTNQQISTYHETEKERTKISTAALITQMWYSYFLSDLVDPMTDILNCFMAGDETNEDPGHKISVLYYAGYDAGMGLTDLGKLNTVSESIMYNYSDEQTNVEADNENSILCVNGLLLTDGTAYTATADANYDKILYTRTFNNTNWQALYVPFAMDYADWSENFEVAQLKEIRNVEGNDVLIVEALEDGSSLVANTPYLIRAKATGTYTLSVDDATAKAASSESKVLGDYTFTGTYDGCSTMYSDGHWALASGELRPAASDGTTLKPMRWYMDVSQAALASVRLAIEFDDAVTGVGSVWNGSFSADAMKAAEPSAEQLGTVRSGVYSVDGRYLGTTVDGLASGLYIVNGKACVIK